VAVGVAVAGVEVAVAGADVVVELEEDCVGGLDEEPHPAASATAASPASNGTNLRSFMALYS
jgi:hypothetical protein